MVPRVAKSGQSFKGALAYYLHDKGANTADRVAWTETRNLGTDNLTVAQAVMIGTAKRADELKAAAGIKAGRKATTGPVYSYSLAWSPEESGQIDRAEMVRAVDASLQAIECKGRQTIIVCHQDTAHPHVHVIVNRVDPDTGKMLSTGDDFKKLSAWALAYREARGEQLKFCPARAEKHEKIAAARTIKAAFETAAQPVRPAPLPKPAPTPSRGATLAQVANAIKERHQGERAALATWYKAERDRVWNNRPSFKAIAAQHRADTRADWSAFGKQQAAERRAFEKTEKTFGGVFANAMASVSQRQLKAGDKGYLKAVFWHIVSKAARAQAFTMHQADGKAAFVKRMGAALDGKMATAKASHGAELDQVRTWYTNRRKSLGIVQDQEKANIRAGWKAYYADRDQAAGVNRRGAWPRRSTTPKAQPPAKAFQAAVAAAVGMAAVAEARRRAGVPAAKAATIEEQTDALLHARTQSPSELRAKYAAAEGRVRYRGERTRAPRTRSRSRGGDDGPEVG